MMKQSKHLTALLITIALLFGVSAAALAAGAGEEGMEAEELVDVNFRLDWLPSAYHAPVFAALENGYWEEEGLNVDVRFGEGSSVTVQLVAGGAADFGWANLTVMSSAVQEGLPIHTVYGIYQKNALGVMVFDDTGIDSASDLEGKSVVITATGEESVMIPLWLAYNGADAESIELVNIESREARRAMFLQREVDAFWETGFSNVPVLQKQTDDIIDFISISDGDRPLALLLQGIVVRDDTIEERPELIESFLKGFQRGFEFSIENPEEAMDIMMARVPEIEDRELSLGILVNSFDLLQTNNTEGMPLGMYSEQDWENTIELLEELGKLNEDLPLDAYFTNEFVPQ